MAHPISLDALRPTSEDTAAIRASIARIDEAIVEARKAAEASSARRDHSLLSASDAEIRSIEEQVFRDTLQGERLAALRVKMLAQLEDALVKDRIAEARRLGDFAAKVCHEAKVALEDLPDAIDRIDDILKKVIGQREALRAYHSKLNEISNDSIPKDAPLPSVVAHGVGDYVVGANVLGLFGLRQLPSKQESFGVVLWVPRRQNFSY